VKEIRECLIKTEEAFLVGFIWVVLIIEGILRFKKKFEIHVWKEW